MSETQFVQITSREKFAEDEFYPMITAMYEQIWQNLLPPQILTHDLSNTIANNVITPTDTPVPDCLTCGACCGSLLCVGVRPSEEMSPEHYWDITTEDENGEIIVDRFLRRDVETLACAALGGTIGEQVGCRIYEQRPRICRMFEAGSDRCHAIRRAYGLEPFLSLMGMYEAVQILKAQPEKHPASEIIEDAKITREPETQNFKITVVMKDRSVREIHVYNPERETWRQFEFSGLTLAEAQALIDARSGAVQLV